MLFMAKIDELKAELGMLKFWLGIFVATFLTIAGWTALNYQKAELILLFGAGLCLIALVIAVHLTNKKIKAKIKDISKE